MGATAVNRASEVGFQLPVTEALVGHKKRKETAGKALCLRNWTRKLEGLTVRDCKLVNKGGVIESSNSERTFGDAKMRVRFP